MRTNFSKLRASIRKKAGNRERFNTVFSSFITRTTVADVIPSIYYPENAWSHSHVKPDKSDRNLQARKRAQVEQYTQKNWDTAAMVLEEHVKDDTILSLDYAKLRIRYRVQLRTLSVLLLLCLYSLFLAYTNIWVLENECTGVGCTL